MNLPTRWTACAVPTSNAFAAFDVAAWGPYEPCPPFIPEDIDQDCEVDFDDLLIVLATWGLCE